MKVFTSHEIQLIENKKKFLLYLFFFIYLLNIDKKNKGYFK